MSLYMYSRISALVANTMSFIEISDDLRIRLFHCVINILSKSRKKKIKCSLNTVVVDSDHHAAMFIAEK